MACPKCNGRLDWKDRSWTTAGEDPGHWRCVNCGKVIYTGTLQATALSFQETFPSPDCDEKEEDLMEGKKVCSKCKIEKSIEGFSINRSNKDGREYWCRECKAKQQRENKRLRQQAKGDNDQKKRQGRKPRAIQVVDPAPNPTEEAIFLGQSVLLAIEKKVALKLLKKFEQMIQEAYA